MEQSTWQEEARIAQLSDGDDQPFYHVLVHSDDYVTFREPGVTYVPQELLSAPQVGNGDQSGPTESGGFESRTSLLGWSPFVEECWPVLAWPMLFSSGWRTLQRSVPEVVNTWYMVWDMQGDSNHESGSNEHANAHCCANISR